LALNGVRRFERLGKKFEGDVAWEKTGIRMTSEEVAEMNRLREASKVRALSSKEEQRLFILNQKNQTRTRVE